jgi:hypothetical protein
MRDLYRMMRLRRGATVTQIREKELELGRLPEVVRATAILLSPNRRAQYDRVHHGMQQIASLRSSLGLGNVGYGAYEFYNDFRLADVTSASARPSLSPTQASAASSPKGNSGVGWIVFVTVFVVAVMLVGQPENSPQTAKPTEAAPVLRTPPLHQASIPVTGSYDSCCSGTTNFIEVKTRTGRHTLVKVERDGREVTRAFIRGGEIWRFSLPAGIYVLKTASGEVWYGPDDLFGPAGSYSRPDDTFALVNAGEGWTVELIPQRDGNLRDRKISAAEF